MLNIAKIPSFDNSLDIFEANFTESTPGFAFIITDEITSSSATLLAVILSEALANCFAVFWFTKTVASKPIPVCFNLPTIFNSSLKK